MDQSQSRALNALAPFLALAKSATSPRAAADLITQATSAPSTYVFAELLQQPNIVSLAANEQYGSYHTLLQIFAWGTWESYKSHADLPKLSDAQTLKLRLLSLLTYAAETRKPGAGDKSESNLSYPSLCSRLDLATRLDLEHLVTTAIYNNLLTGTLNPSTQTVVITSLSPLRDLAPASIPSLLASLSSWSARCDSVLADLQSEIAEIELRAQKRVRAEMKREKQVAAAMDGGEKGSGGGGGGGGGRNTRNSNRRDEEEGDGDEMDVDGGLGAGGGKKRGGGGAGGIAGMVGRAVGRGGR